MPCPRRPGSEGGQDSASPSQVQAILRHPAASGWRAGRAARSRAGEDLTRFSRTHRSCTVEVSPTLPSSKSRISIRPEDPAAPYDPVCVPRRQIGVGIYRTPRTYPRWPSGTGKPVSRSCLLGLTSPVPMATPLSLTFSPTMSSARRIFATPASVNRWYHVQVTFTFGLARHTFPA